MMKVVLTLIITGGMLMVLLKNPVAQPAPIQFVLKEV